MRAYFAVASLGKVAQMATMRKKATSAKNNISSPLLTSQLVGQLAVLSSVETGQFFLLWYP